MTDLTPLGDLLEHARERLSISKREAARRAGISEGRWRQIVSGQQRSGDAIIAVNPRRITVAAMARAVGVAEDEALQAAGLTPLTSAEAIRVAQIYPKSGEDGTSVEALIQGIYDSDMPEERKNELVRLIRRAEAQRAADLRAAEDELGRWRRAAG